MLALGAPASTLALLSDRQQPLEVNADSTIGTLGDGTATLEGNVEIQQGSAPMSHGWKKPMAASAGSP